ncbi:NHLP leader peptide family RiPP precursor [Tenacibaculum skagerrakense]|nr:NHLP leader peptide family RiPP precursor [Tenacibaculum skagerrakense]
MEPTEEQKVFKQIIVEAWENPDFKEELMNSPLEAIQQLTGKTLIIPEGKTFVVKDQSNESIIYFNIPAKPNMEDVELDDDQLDIVAGGGGETLDPPIILSQESTGITVSDGGS